METTAKRKRVYLGLSVAVALVLLAAWVYLFAPQPIEPRYTITDFGMANGSESIYLMDLNDKGQIVGARPVHLAEGKNR